MALLASQVRVAGTGELYVAPVGTAEPADVDNPMPEPWTGLGYTSEDGCTLERAVEKEGIPVWQSITPVRYITTEGELTAQATYYQTNKQVWALYFGATFDDGNTPPYRAEIPAVPGYKEFAMCLEWADGEVKSRLYFARSEIKETGESQITRTAAIGYDMTIGALAPSEGPLGVLLTNDPAFAGGDSGSPGPITLTVVKGTSATQANATWTVPEAAAVTIEWDDLPAVSGQLPSGTDTHDFTGDPGAHTFKVTDENEPSRTQTADFTTPFV